MTTVDERVFAAMQAIRDFAWDDYGLDDVDPDSEYAEWVQPLAEAIVAAVSDGR